MPLENIKKGGIVEHMEHQLKLVTLQQYSKKDKKNEKFVYAYDQQDDLQTGTSGDRKIAVSKRYSDVVH